MQNNMSNTWYKRKQKHSANYTCYVTQDLFHNKLKLTNSSFRTSRR